jgi:hypothetical protein
VVFFGPTAWSGEDAAPVSRPSRRDWSVPESTQWSDPESGPTDDPSGMVAFTLTGAELKPAREKQLGGP